MSENKDVLAALQDQVASRVPEQYRDAFGRVLTAGRRLMYDKSTHPVIEQQIASAGDPVAAVGTGAAELMGLLIQNSKGTMPKAVIGPAMVALMGEGLDYLRQTGRAKGDAADVDRATQALSEALMGAAGVTPQSFDAVLAKAQDSLADPQVAAKMKEFGHGA